MSSQTFHVLLCVVCKTFQVQIVKKSSNKWNCKICDSKQSVQQVYAKGTGAECRDIVQRLNEARGKREESKASKTLSGLSGIAQAEQEASGGGSHSGSHDADSDYTLTSGSQAHNSGLQNSDKPAVLCVPREKSVWTVFLEDN